MKIYRNLSQIQKKEQLGRRLSLTGLFVLFVGLISSFIPNWYPPGEPTSTALTAFLRDNWPIISFAALPLGFICASVGSYFINRFARRRWPGSKQLGRPDEVLARSMKGLDDKYAFFAWALPTHYLLAGPHGLLLIAARGDKGRVIINGGRYREPFSFKRIFTVFAREGVGNPTQELAGERKKLEEIMARSGEAGAELNASGENDLLDVPIHEAVVFLNNDVQLELNDPAVPALRTKEVKPFVRNLANQVRLRTSTLRRLKEYLVAQGEVDEVT